ncbi:hypothetical protein DFR30_0393 [Thiogranum longum]|uniref:PH (Pleckstrin Homology) domain-containing protein n=1 Tax=Thiogranum longum TaxID=1537524 RepID=A0A4R1HIZ2_9GAMM|nr:hypothetical protein [Thiogranum longum]TCK17172.1 hypothetical protein DFR30_0393 [Thiogranum longum]
MSLVLSNEILEPKLKVAPPKIVIWIFGIILSIAIVLVIYSPIASVSIKGAIAAVIALILFGIVKNQKKGNYLATMQANNAGLYFQTDEQNLYYYVPWKYIGVIEKAVFPLNSRGLRIEVIEEESKKLKDMNQVGNIREENGRTYIYTIPQLLDRDKLLNDLMKFKESA